MINIKMKYNIKKYNKREFALLKYKDLITIQKNIYITKVNKT